MRTSDLRASSDDAVTSMRAPRRRWPPRARARAASCTRPSRLAGGTGRRTHQTSARRQDGDRRSYRARPATRRARRRRRPARPRLGTTSLVATDVRPPVEPEDLRPHERDRRDRTCGHDQPDSDRQAACAPAGEHDGRRRGRDPDPAAQLGHEATAAAADVEPQLDGEQRERHADGDEPAPTSAGRRPAPEHGQGDELDGGDAGGQARPGQRAVAPPVDEDQLQRGADEEGEHARRRRWPGPATTRTTSSPSSTGSKVRPQPPCSLGRATARHGARSTATEPAGAARAARWTGAAVDSWTRLARFERAAAPAPGTRDQCPSVVERVNAAGSPCVLIAGEEGRRNDAHTTLRSIERHRPGRFGGAHPGRGRAGGAQRPRHRLPAPRSRLRRQGRGDDPGHDARQRLGHVPRPHHPGLGVRQRDGRDHALLG